MNGLWTKLLSEVEPTDDRKEEARRSHEHLQKRLDSGIIGSRVDEVYLSGSYARDTAIEPIDDVDIIFVVDPDPWMKFLDWNRPAPEAVIKTFSNAVRYRYDRSHVRVQRRSVGLRMKHLDIDIVPSIPGDEDGVIWIPDRRSDTWIRSAPRRYEAIAQELDEATCGAFKAAVKLLKHWNSQIPQPARLKSYTIETIVARVLDATGCDDVEDAVESVFDFLWHLNGYDSDLEWEDTLEIEFGLYGRITGYVVPDLAIGSNTAGYLDSERRNKFLARAATAARHLDKSRRARYAHTEEEHLRKALHL